ncbi:uncharacterized protein AAEQ78_013166 isoform 2-T4 [Lycaon pictus]
MLLQFMVHCCAEDYVSEEPPRSRHRCKHTRVYLQARAWIQEHPTQRSRDLGTPAFELMLSLLLTIELCPRLRIRETTKEPTVMQAHEGLLTSSSLDPSIPDTEEQGLGPQACVPGIGKRHPAW